MNELRDLLERATDRIETPDLAAHALAGARRRRTTHRSVLAAGVAAVLVVLIAVSGQLSRGGDDSSPPVTPPSRTPDSPTIPDSVVQELWDPTEVADLPRGGSTLPEVVAPPPDAPSLQGSAPTAGYRLVTFDQDENALFFLGADGAWRRCTPPGDLPWTTAVDTSGNLAAMFSSDGIWWADLGEGTWQRMDVPAGLDLYNGGLSLDWLGGGDLVASDGRRTWLLDPTGQLDPLELPYPDRRSTGFDVWPGLEAVDFHLDGKGRRVMTRWQGEGEGDTTAVEILDVIERPVLGERSIAAVRTVSSHPDDREGADWDGLVAIDRATLGVRAYLPLDDDQGGYAEGGALRPLGWLDDDTVLAYVFVRPDTPDAGWHIVTWDVETGDLARLAGGDPDTQLVGVAIDLVDGSLE